RPAYHPFTSRNFARGVRLNLEKEERFKGFTAKKRDSNLTPRRFTIFGIGLPNSSIHGELIRRKLIRAEPSVTPIRLQRKYAWKNYRVVRLEVPGIQNNVPVVVGTFTDKKGKRHEAAIGVSAVGNRGIPSMDCPRHHRLNDEAFAKLLQRLIHTPKKPS
ncbi:MAG: hypothetical protein Q8P02_00665, partial [Candidatus Micrarchaeota archaeon]|nr:hypothetical protein [Candidatus Micrarchaeota archaeon]